MNRHRPLPVEFYDRAVEQVARDLLGTNLHTKTSSGHIFGTIVETEAYGGAEDLASHAAFRKTGVVQYMHGKPGSIYVYKEFGMYPCLNVVTGAEGSPSAVLIRAVSLIKPSPDNATASGPGRLGRAFNLDVTHNGLRLTEPPFWIESTESAAIEVSSGPRVGVKRGDHRHWRFAIAGHPAVSRPKL